MNKLYLIERDIKQLSDAEKLSVRQQKSEALLEKLKKWLDNNRSRVAKDSLTGKAMTYLHNQWEKLACSGQLQPDTFLKELSNSIGD